MKTLLLVLGLFCATAAWGQATNGGLYSPLNAEPTVVEFYTHTRHADPTPMAHEDNLLIRSPYVHEQGVRPLWEVATPVAETPLGDSARVLRKEHDAAKRAKIIWEN